MAFCTKCGAPVEGEFCTRCGTKLDSPGEPGAETPQPGPAAPSSVPPPPTAPPPAYSASQAAAAPTARKRSPLLWILGGCLGLIIIGGIILLMGGYFVAKKAGLDTDLASRNPEMAAAKMIASLNPDIEIISMDEERGTFEILEKETGRTITVNTADLKEGRISFTNDQGEQIEFQAQGEGDDTELEIRSSDGSILMGSSSSAQLPSWLPVYPGALEDGSFGMSTNGGRSGSCAFKTEDSAENIAEFYKDALESVGFDVVKNETRFSGQQSMIILSATESNTERNAQVMISTENQETTITLTFEDKE